VENIGTSTATLQLYVSQTNYTLPVGTPLLVESGLGGSVENGTLGLTGIFQAYADSGNTLLGMGYTNGAQNATADGSSFDTGSASGLFNRGVTNYSLTSVVTFTLSEGGLANFSDHVKVTAAPEPGAVALALTGLPFLGIGNWLRRRKVKVQDC